MTRNDLCELINQYAIAYSKYTVELVLAGPDSFVQPKPPLNPCGLIHDSFEQQICDNCRYDYCGCSVQDLILQVDPEATFTTFGCNRFESCK